MAATITDGLKGIAQADLSGLQKRIDILRAEAGNQLKLQAESMARMSVEEIINVLSTAKKASS